MASLNHRFTLAASLLLVAAGCTTTVVDGGSAPTPAPTSAPTDSPPPDPPPAREIPAGWEDALKETLSEIDGQTGLGPDLKVDRAKVEAEALGLLRTGGKDATAGFRLGVHAIVSHYPVGHLQVYPKDFKGCGTVDLPSESTSFVDACTQPYQDHAVVTVVGKDNPLGLLPGDEVLAIDDKSGQAMLDATFARPACGTGSPSAAHRRAVSATSIFDSVAVGAKVKVKHVGGAVETKTVSRITAKPVSCRDPWGRTETYVAKATIRPDGAAVLRIPSFSPKDFDEKDPQGSIERFQTAIHDEFVKVKDAPRLIIDVRGNPGGATLVGLAIAAGMPGAQKTKIAKCSARDPHTNEYSRAFDYDLAPATGPSSFAYAGRVALVSDGLAFSAADYFVRTMRTATNAVVVGRGQAGAYGGSTDEVTITKGPGLVLYPDPWRCTDPVGGVLEGQTAKPDLETELEPVDIAKGIDSDIEAALGLLLKPAAELPGPGGTK